MLGDYLSDFVEIQVDLVPPVEVATGLGDVLFLTLEGSSPMPNGYAYVNASGVAALLASNQITANGAAMLDKMFSQNIRPARVLVATYVNPQ